MKRTLWVLLLLLGGWVQAQTSYQVSSQSSMFIDGTSTIHDWTATVGQVSGTFQLDDAFAKKNGPKAGAVVSGGRLQVVVSSIDGGKGATMNDKIVAAFQAERHPHIVFTLKQARVLPGGTGQAFDLRAEGDLAMAGQTHPLGLDLKGKRLADGTYEFTGRHAMKMTTYGMTPPTALFGQIETGDEIVIRFTLHLKP
ncbi:MAG: hypothetical protein OHK0039_42510 [Bacteroidia bacterium]